MVYVALVSHTCHISINQSINFINQGIATNLQFIKIPDLSYIYMQYLFVFHLLIDKF